MRPHDYGCSLKLFRAGSSGRCGHGDAPVSARAGGKVGARITRAAGSHRPRVHGRSKYGISRTVRVILDLVTVKFLLSYATRPLQIFGLLGLVMGGIGGSILGYLGVMRLLERESLDQHQPLLLFSILLAFTGVQLVTIGLLAEMQARTYHESQNKPVYASGRYWVRHLGFF